MFSLVQREGKRDTLLFQRALAEKIRRKEVVEVS